MLVVLGACLAGIFLISRELIPLVSAWSSGVIRTRGANPKRVRRDEEPERFKALCRNRFNAMGLGFLAIGFGLLWIWLGLLALIPAIIVSLILTARARRPKKASRAVVDEFT